MNEFQQLLGSMAMGSGEDENGGTVPFAPPPRGQPERRPPYRRPVVQEPEPIHEDPPQTEVEQRLEEAGYFKLLLSSQIFPDATEIGQRVENKIRTWAENELLLLLGMGGKVSAGEFTPSEVIVLRSVVKKLLGNGRKEDAPPPAYVPPLATKVEAPPAKLRPIVTRPMPELPRPMPKPGPKPVPKRKLGAPLLGKKGSVLDLVVTPEPKKAPRTPLEAAPVPLAMPKGAHLSQVMAAAASEQVSMFSGGDKAISAALSLGMQE